MERGKQRFRELQSQVTKDWNALIADVQAAVEANEAVTGLRAQALAARWKTLVEGFTGGDPEIQKGLNKMWSDQQNWPGKLRSQYAIDPKVQDFIVRVSLLSCAAFVTSAGDRRVRAGCAAVRSARGGRNGQPDADRAVCRFNPPVSLGTMRTP